MKKEQINGVIEMPLSQARSEGYTSFLFSDDGFQGINDLSDITDRDLERDDVRLVDKDPYHPKGISASLIADHLADIIQERHTEYSGDDTGGVYHLIKSLDFSGTEKLIDDALSTLSYYTSANIKPIKD